MGCRRILMNFDNFNEYSRVFVNPGAGIIVPLSKSTASLILPQDFSPSMISDYLPKTGMQGTVNSFINMKLGLLFGK